MLVKKVGQKSQKKLEKRVAFLRAALHNNPRVEEVANMVGVAQLAERLTVAQEVQGSSPCTHPILEVARAVSSAGSAGDS